MNTETKTNDTIHPKLKSFLDVLPLLHKVLPDVGMGVTDRSAWLAYYPGTKIDIRAEQGRAIDPKEPLADCIENSRFIKDEVPEAFFGVSFTGLAAPVMEDGEVIGALAIQMQEYNERELRRISDQIAGSLTNANEQVGAISESAGGLAKSSNALLLQSNEAAESMKNTDEVLEFIRKIASRTNILGLNASIEAARAGEYGQGFNIVAKEIRKLSQETLDSTEKIEKTLSGLRQSIDEIQSVVEQVVKTGKEQATSTEELAKFISEIEQMSQGLKKYAKEI
ncbi:methyl-accepting chemotaxis protein [Salisediminibacterium beveridgei]|uniref:Methyl-accepting chemotaxis protein n=1 Tax=Salisediminibacterium beveridgei TaxID=632773 RepID=A0A1D7QXP9_9BACI|nr:methyl-accepting chemotaxis protein [Salisediminibacterium beveridgei]AOM83779.1 Methyl-accepting chemotaxis protein [Salisediminibacterium beveridgei]